MENLSAGILRESPNVHTHASNIDYYLCFLNQGMKEKLRREFPDGDKSDYSGGAY
jgi:hypothetical protein